MGRTDGQRLRSRVVHRRVGKRSLPSCSGAASPPQHYSAVYKSLPCRGAVGFGRCGAAPGDFPSSGTGSAPINALGGCARSMSRCLFRRLFLRSCSFTPRSLATMHRGNRKRHYTRGYTLFPGHRMVLVGRFSAFRTHSSSALQTVMWGQLVPREWVCNDREDLITTTL
jgi:hypothetical protein